jgi:hypothetical protein
MGVPILFVVRESPQAFYLILVFMIFVTCAAILLLIFVPKVVLADTFSQHSPQQQSRMLKESIRTSRELIQAGRSDLGFRRASSSSFPVNPPHSSSASVRPDGDAEAVNATGLVSRKGKGSKNVSWCDNPVNYFDCESSQANGQPGIDEPQPAESGEFPTALEFTEGIFHLPSESDVKAVSSLTREGNAEPTSESSDN